MCSNAPANEIIEEDGIKALENMLPTYCCQSFVKIASTEASFDGHINFFEDRNKNKKSGMLQIPVQIKCTTLEYNSNSFSVDVSDLDNYKINGVCFFVIRMEYNNDQTEVVRSRIIAKNFVGREVLDILSNLDENQKNKTIDLAEMHNKDDIKQLFQSYKIKQETVTKYNYIDSTKPLIGQVSLLGDNNQFARNPEIGKKYFAIFKAGDNTFFAHDFKIDESHLPLNGCVKANGKVFFTSFEKVDSSSGGVSFVFSEALTLAFVDNGFRIDLNKYALIDDYINGLSFVVAALSSKSFSLNDYAIPLLNTGNNLKTMIQNYSNVLTLATIVRGVFKSVGYDKPFSLMDLKKEDISNIAILYTKLIEGTVDYFLLKTNLFTKMIARIFSQGKVLFLSFFDENLYKAVKFKMSNSSGEKTTPFIYVSANQWAEMDLAGIDIFKSIISNNVTTTGSAVDDYKTVINNLLISYKRSNRKLLLEYAKFLNNYFSFNLNIKRLIGDL